MVFYCDLTQRGMWGHTRRNDINDDRHLERDMDKGTYAAGLLIASRSARCGSDEFVDIPAEKM